MTNTEGSPAARRRRQALASRSRSLRTPAHPAPPAARPGWLLHWSGWTKLGALLATLSTVAVAGGTVGALYFTNQTLHATDNQYGLSQQTAVTDRFRLAAEQLASDKISIRISGIYLFERLAKDSPSDHETVFAVLGTFVRTQISVAPCETTALESAPGPVSISAQADIYTALTVIGRRNADAPQFSSPTDLRRICLAGADLQAIDLHDVDLEGAILTGANLSNVDFSGTYLKGADLTHANLAGSDLAGSTLTWATLDDISYTVSTRWPAGFTPPRRR
ncbi:pentapeptide repeat-containing protein [Nocardia sp. NPDC059246]|uniref:pentapeptide repeat-containing protein n=1 Tax=unclassified Nocardia TaxID=2637762 RepID=UPI0036A19E95